MSQPQQITVSALCHDAAAELTPRFGQREAAALVDEMIYRIKGWDKVQQLIRAHDEASQYLVTQVKSTIGKLMANIPIQYIFGKARFYGMDFTVTPDTLIPRPETATLVDMIVKRYGSTPDLQVLDLGTGSGCIAISLSRNLPFAHVTAVDISEKALAVARENARELKAAVNFIRKDMTSEPDFSVKFELIVSNPPYISESEAAGMDCNVLDNEPHSALFVPDSDPLKYYRAIAEIAQKNLSDNGAIYLEINPLFAARTCDLLREKGFGDITVEKDMQRADRFIIASRPTY